MLSDENKLTVIDDAGTETELRILFTFTYEETGKKYVVTEDESGENVMGFRFDDDGNLFNIDEEEMEMCQEVLDSFDEENEL